MNLSNQGNHKGENKMLKVVRNSPEVKDVNGFSTNEMGWVVVTENKTRVSSNIHYSFKGACREIRRLEKNHYAQKETRLQEMLSYIDLDEMLDTLNKKCGNGQPLTLQEKQAIRFMVEELSKAVR